MKPPRARVGPSLVVLLGGLTALVRLSVHMYLPACPSLEAELHTSASLVELTVGAAVSGSVRCLAVAPGDLAPAGFPIPTSGLACELRFVYPTALALGLAQLPIAAGAASGLLSVTQTAFGAAVAAVVAVGAYQRAVPLACISAVVTIARFGLFVPLMPRTAAVIRPAVKSLHGRDESIDFATRQQA